MEKVEEKRGEKKKVLMRDPFLEKAFKRPPPRRLEKVLTEEEEREAPWEVKGKDGKGKAEEPFEHRGESSSQDQPCKEAFVI